MHKSKAIGIGLASFLFLILIGLAWQVAAQDETLPFGETVTHEVSANQANRWVFEANRNDILQFDLARIAGNLEATLIVRNRNDETQFQLNASPEGNIQAFIYRVPEFGEYRVEVAPQNNTSGRYELSLERLEVGLREFEQGRIAYGQTVTQKISDSIPYHLWSFTGQEGEVIDLRMLVLEGDLRPVITITSPGGDVIASQNIASRRADGQLETRLLAFRLPGNGTYRISARRSGENLGFSGNTSGRYELNLTLRNGSQATTNILRPGDGVAGRLTLDSPIALYEIIDPATYWIKVEFSDANCLVDLTLTDRGIAILETHQGRSPFYYALEVPVVVQPILELSSSHCPNPERLDYQLNLIPSRTELPNHFLTQSVHSQGEIERWFFPAQAGDIINLQANPERLQTATNIRILNPSQEIVFRGRLYPHFQQELWLTEEGIYSIQVESRGTPYTLSYQLVGDKGRLFQSQTPIATELIDVGAPALWQILVENRGETTLVVENPKGETLASARSTELNPAALDYIFLPQAGRYTVKVFSETRPQAIISAAMNRDQLTVEQSVKGTLTSPLARDVWIIPNMGNTPFDLELEILTPNLISPPELVVLDQSNVLVTPDFNRTTRNGINLFRLNPSADGGNYQVLVSRRRDLEYTDYRLSVNPLGATPQISATSLNAAEEFETQTPQISALPYWLAPPINRSSPVFFENAERLSSPSQNRIELQADESYFVGRLNIQRNQLVTLEASQLGGETPPGISLLDEDLNIVAERWERENEINLLYYRTPRAGTYYIALTGDPTGGRYLLNVGTTPNINELVPEVGNELPLELGKTYAGAFNSRQETLTYAFWGVQNTEIIVQTFYELGDLAPNLEVITPSQGRLVEAEFDPETYHIQTEPLRLTETGLYRLILRATPINRDLSYSRFYLQTHLVKSDDLTEGLLEEEVISTLGPEKQSVTWIFHNDSNELLNFQLEPLTNGPSPLTLSISDTEGNLIYQRNNALSVNQINIRDLLLPKSGLYRVSVSGGDSLGGIFRLGLARNSDFLEQTDYPIGYGQTRQRTFSPENRLDRWVLAGNEGDVIAVSLRYQRGDPSLMGLQIESEQGELIFSTSSPDGTSGVRADNLLLPYTGIYWISVGALDSETLGSTAYSLSTELQNQLQQQTSNGLLRFGVPHEGTLFANNPSNYWVFRGNAGVPINLTVTGDGQFEPAFDLYYVGSEDRLTRTGNLNTPAILSEYVLPQTGTYILRITSIANRTGHYTLSLEQTTLPTPVSAILQAGETYNTSLTRGQATVWELTGETGEEISFRLDIPRRSSLEPQLSLLAPDGTILWVTSTSDKTLTIPSYILPQTGTYRLEISAVLGAESIPNNSEYTLTFQRVNAAPTRFIRPLEYNNSGINELLESNPSNLWSFEGQTGDAITLEGVRTSGDLDLSLTLIDPLGMVIASDDDGLGNLDAQIQTVLPQDGKYLVEIATIRDHVVEEDNNYRLDLRLDYRPAQTARLEQRIRYGERLIGSFDAITEETNPITTWEFMGQNGDRIEAILQFPANDSPLRLYLTDGTGQVYLQGERVGDRTLIRDFKLPADGLYYLRLERSLDSLESGFYPYSLALNLVDALIPTSYSAFIQAGNSQSVRLEESAQTWFYVGQANEEILLAFNQLTVQDKALKLTVLSPNQQILLNTTASETATRLTLPYDGIYQIIVQNLKTNESIDYQIHVASQLPQTPTLRQLLAYQDDQGVLSSQIPREEWIFEGQAGGSAFVQIVADPRQLIGEVVLTDSVGVIRAYGQEQNGRWTLYTTLPNDDTYQLSILKSQANSAIGSYRILLTPMLVAPEFIQAHPLSPSDWLTGNLSGSDREVFSFWGEANTPSTISTRSQDDVTTISLEILDAEGKTLSLGGNEIANFYPPADGYYLVRAFHPTPIRFEIIHTPRPNENFIPDLSISPLNPQVNFTSTLSPDFTSEIWSLDGKPGETILIEVDDFNLSVRHDVILFDPLGQPLANALEAPNANRVVVGPILLPLDGIYTVRVGAWLGATTPNPSPYNIRYDPVTDVLGSNGGHIAVLGQAVWGGLTSNEAEDSWTFDGEIGATLTITLDNGLAAIEGVELELVAPDGARLDLSADTQVTALGLTIPNIFLPTTGSYSIKVKLSREDEVEEPLIYRLGVSQNEAQLRDALAQAQPITPAVAQTGVFNPETSRQTWVFFAQAGETFSVTTESDFPLRLILIDPQGQAIAGGYTGELEATLLNQDGFYGIVVENPQPEQDSYTITLQADTIQAKWRWTLHPDDPIRAILSLGAPIHEWHLNGQTAGEYYITLRPNQGNTKLNVYLQDQNGEVLALGATQADGIVQVRAYLQDSSQENYQVIVTAPNLPSAYDIIFSLATNSDSPTNIFSNQAQSGEITPLDTVDEWIWTSDRQTLLTLNLEKTSGDAALGLRIYAPGNLLLSEYAIEVDRVVQIQDLLIPVEGTYIIQVVRTDDVTRPTQANYVLTLSEKEGE